jgi:excisionase family DNA binding protein
MTLKLAEKTRERRFEMQQTWLTVQEVAAIYRVKVPTIRLWTRNGLPHLKAGRLVRFDAQKVLEWLEKKQEGNSVAVVHQETSTSSDKHAA